MTVSDFIANGSGHGDVASVLINNNFDIGALRPYVGNDGRPYITCNKDGKSVPMLAMNAPALLRKDEWKMLDDAVMDAVYTTPAVMFPDLRASGNVIRIPNGIGKTIFEYQRMSDIGGAQVSMDGISESLMDRPEFDLTGLPLPIIHKDFQFSARQIAVSRNGGPPLDTSMARLAARKVMEEVEKFTVGLSTFSYGGYTIYGFTNFPQRMTHTITAPTSTNHGTTIAEILAMRKKLTEKQFNGPYRLYMSLNWDNYLDEDFSTVKGTNTFRERILAIDGIQSVKTTPWLTGNTILMVQMTPDVAQAVIGVDVTTIQWPSKGGMLVNFKVMAVMVPLIRADINGICGIVHGS